MYRHAAAGCFGPGWCGVGYPVPSLWISLAVCFDMQVHNEDWVNRNWNIVLCVLSGRETLQFQYFLVALQIPHTNKFGILVVGNEMQKGGFNT